MHKNVIAAAFGLLTALPLSAQTDIQHYVPGITPSGITYYLPTTNIRFVIEATRTTHHPGQYAMFAERFLDVKDATQVAYDTWTFDAVTPVAFGTPDPEQVFSIALNPKTSAPLVTITPDGILTAVNEEIEFPPILPTASVKAVATEQLNPNEFLTTDILRAASISKKAELTAEEIYDIRENRDLLAKGQADFNPADGEQLRLMLERLDRSERALTSLFVGTTTIEKHTFIIDFTPKAACESMPFFRFSKHLGLVDNDDLSGEPYFITLTDETTLVGAAASLAAAAQNVKPKKEIPDLRYRIPGRARIVLSNTTNKVIEFTAPVAQFGKIEHLGGDLFNKKFTTRVRLNPVTGNIEKIDIPDFQKSK